MFILVPLFATSFALADVQIQDVVPESTILVISTSDVGKVITHLQDSGVCDTISEVASSVKELSGSDSCSFGSTECTEILGQLGIDKETWTPPNGDAGFALYPVVDYEVGSVGIGYLGMIELDDPLYDNLFSEKFEEFVGNAEVEYETVSLSGRDVWMFDYSLPATAPVPSLNIDPNAFSRTYLVYSDGYLIFGSEPDAIASAFSAIDGEPENGTLASNADYLSMLDICGTDGDVFAAVLLTNLADTIMQIDSSGMAMMFLPTLKAAVGDIDGIAESVTISPSSDVFIEATYTALMNDGRSGLMGLIGENTTSESMPSFVAPDALSYSQCQINLSKFTTLIKETMMSNPMLGMQMAGQMEQMEAGFDLFFNPLGSTVHSFSTGRLPFTDESVGYLVAIECTDEEAFGNALGATLPMMGATPSDFLGNQLFTIDFSSAMPMPLPYPLEMSLAVGGGYAFIGTTHTVESALRSIANPKTSKNNLDSNAALSMLSNEDVSSWGFSDLKKSIEFQTAMSEAMTKDMFDEMEAFDPEMAAEMRAEFDKNSELQTKISDAIGSLIGPMAWNMTVDDTGLTAHAIMLKPKSD
jgi:hypothetical protein